jgi:lysophospholipase L1-like esterase
LRRLLVAVAVTLVLAEIGLRIVMGNLSIMEMLELHPGDGRCIGLRPGVTVPYTGFLWKIEPVAHDVNGLGYRGPERPQQKQPGVMRVAVLGDSFAYGQAVRADQAIPAYLEPELRSRLPGKNVEVFNFGVPGLNAQEYREQFELFAAKWQPDVVIIYLFENDLEPPMCALAEGRTFWWYLRNVYVFRLVAFATRVYGSSRPEVERPVRRLEKAIASLVEAIRKTGAVPAIVVLGDPLRHELRRDENAPASPLLQAFFAESRVAWFDHTPEKWGAQIPGEGHFTPDANKQLAVLTADWLREVLERGAPPQPM